MYNEELETLIDAALADGVLTEKEKQILFKRAQSLGIDLDEFEIVLDTRMLELQKKRNSSGVSNADVSNIINRYRREFESIKKTRIDSQFRPYTRTGKRGEYIDVERFDDEGTIDAQKSYILSLHPSGKEESLAALRFLLSFLPSGKDDVGQRRQRNPFVDDANNRFRAIVENASSDYSSDASFVSKLNSIKSEYNRIAALIEDGIKSQNKMIKKMRIKKKIRLYSILVLLAAAWLLMIVDDLWWLCLLLNVLTLGIYGFCRLTLIIDDIEDAGAKEQMKRYNDEIKKFEQIV